MTNPLAFVDWEDFEIQNSNLCLKNGYQHGTTSDGHETAKALFAIHKAKNILPLHEVIDLFRELHRAQPFLFLNGNTFAVVGRDIVTWVCGSVNAETRSRVGHHIAGTAVLTRSELERLLSSNQKAL